MLLFVLLIAVSDPQRIDTPKVTVAPPAVPKPVSSPAWPPPPPVKTCPNHFRSPTDGRLDLREGFRPDPQRRAIAAAGGPVELRQCQSATGWVSEAPNLELVYQTSGKSRLSITVESNADTILLVRTPAGSRLYDDDSGQTNNAKLTIQRAAAGTYAIWVGTFSSGPSTKASVAISQR